MKKRTFWILAASVAAVAFGAAAVGAVAVLFRGRTPGSAAGKSYLLLRLEGEIPEQPASELPALLERRAPSLRTLVESLDRAATDPAISAAIVRVGMLPDAGWGRVQELRDAIRRFRGSGKPAYAHLDFCGNKEYYLATACSRIYALPSAILDVSGLSLEVTFLRGTLDKLGVEAQFEGIGRYKNAPNQYTEAGFTEPHREQMEALADSLFGELVRAIAQSRGKSAEEVRAIIDRGPFEAGEAKAAGLVDDLLYQDQVEAALGLGPKTTPGQYVRSTRPFLDARPKLAVVHAVGEIVPGASRGGPLGGEYAGADTISAGLHQASEDASIRAIVLRVDSPGGFGPAADSIWRAATLAKKTKPVVVSMGDYAASGGYYIAMAGDAIVAQPGTLTGSIGVFSGKFNLRGFYDKIGLSKGFVERGRNAGMYGDYRPWSPQERARVQAMNAAFYEGFVGRAAQARRKPVADLDALAQGRVWTGADAVEKGLVDRLGGLDEAVSLAKQRAGIPSRQDVALVVLPERRGLLETLLERQEEAGLESGLPADVRAFLRWSALLHDGAPLARLPFDLRAR